MPDQNDFRPTEQRGLTRKKMIEATIALLAREGYARTSWRRVAEEAGVTTGVLQYHFGDKARLLTAVVEYLSEEHTPALRQARPDADASLRERVESFVSVAFELMSGQREASLEELLVGLRKSNEPGVSANALEAITKTQDDVWRGLFQDVPVSEERLIAIEHLLFAALHGFSIQNLFGKSMRFQREREALVDAITCLLTNSH